MRERDTRNVVMVLGEADHRLLLEIVRDRHRYELNLRRPEYAVAVADLRDTITQNACLTENAPGERWNAPVLSEALARLLHSRLWDIGRVAARAAKRWNGDKGALSPNG